MESLGYSHGSKTEAYEKVATRFKVNVKTIQRWIKDFEAMSYIRESQQGKHSKTYSPILEDESFREDFKAYVKENSKKRGTFSIFQLANRIFIK